MSAAAQPNPVEGWCFPLNSRKAHYIDAGGRSLCRKWLWLGRIQDTDNAPSPDDCATCRRKLDERPK